MANSRSAVKRIRTSEKRRVRNKQVKTRVKTAIRRFHDTLENGDQQEIEGSLRAVMSQIDRAVVKGILHRNTAARKKAQLHRAVAEREVG